MSKVNDEPEIHWVENRLNSKLQPVAPRRDFVNGLYAHLLEPSPITIRTRKADTDFLVILGVICGMVIIITGIYTLLGRFKRSRLVQSTSDFVDHQQPALSTRLPANQVSAPA